MCLGAEPVRLQFLRAAPSTSAPHRLERLLPGDRAEFSRPGVDVGGGFSARHHSRSTKRYEPAEEMLCDPLDLWRSLKTTGGGQPEDLWSRLSCVWCWSLQKFLPSTVITLVFKLSVRGEWWKNGADQALFWLRHAFYFRVVSRRQYGFYWLIRWLIMANRWISQGLKFSHPMANLVELRNPNR